MICSLKAYLLIFDEKKRLVDPRDVITQYLIPVDNSAAANYIVNIHSYKSDTRYLENDV